MADREFRRPTPAQDKARARNWRIFRIRGLRAQLPYGLLTGWRLKVALWLIDRELLAMGATAKPKRPHNPRIPFNPHPLGHYTDGLDESELPF